MRDGTEERAAHPLLLDLHLCAELSGGSLCAFERHRELLCVRFEQLQLGGVEPGWRNAFEHHASQASLHTDEGELEAARDLPVRGVFALMAIFSRETWRA